MGDGERKMKMTQDQRLKLGKFLQKEMHDEKKKKPEERRERDQLIAIGYAKLRSGEI